jgi:hypothetical protein
VSESGQPGDGRARLLIAGGLGVALVLAVAAVIALGGDSTEHEFTEAPGGCLADWNGDPAAVSFGRHQSGAHHYFDVQVLMLSPDGRRELPAGDPKASCAVVFAASALDPEPISAAQIHSRGEWAPLAQEAEFNRLAELQKRAQAAYNARVTPEGTLEPL